MSDSGGKTGKDDDKGERVQEGDAALPPPPPASSSSWQPLSAVVRPPPGMTVPLRYPPDKVINGLYQRFMDTPKWVAVQQKQNQDAKGEPSPPPQALYFHISAHERDHVAEALTRFLRDAPCLDKNADDDGASRALLTWPEYDCSRRRFTGARDWEGALPAHRQREALHLEARCCCPSSDLKAPDGSAAAAYRRAGWDIRPVYGPDDNNMRREVWLVTGITIGWRTFELPNYEDTHPDCVDMTNPQPAT